MCNRPKRSSAQRRKRKEWKDIRAAHIHETEPARELAKGTCVSYTSPDKKCHQAMVERPLHGIDTLQNPAGRVEAPTIHPALGAGPPVLAQS